VRRTAPRALVVVSSLLLIAAALAAYGRRVLFDSDQFANRAAATLQDARVRTVIADQVTDRLVLARQSDLLAARPIISSAVAGIVGSDAFGSLFRRSALDVHRAVFARDQDTVTMTLADVGIVAAEALRTVKPKLANQLADSGRVVLVKRRVGAVTGDLARVADGVRILALVLAALALATAAAAIALARDRRRTVSRLGLGAVVAGVVLVVACTVSRAIALGFVEEPDNRAAAGAVWDAFLGDLRTFGWLLAGAGAVVAAAAASLIHPAALEGPVSVAWRIATTEPRSPWPRAARGVALAAVGVLVIAEPTAALHVAITLVGVYLLYQGVTAILRLIYRPPEPDAEAATLHRVPRIAVPLIVTLAIAAAFAAFYVGGGATTPAAAVTGCNGHEELCDRPLDKVALAATHNSMSAPLAGWFSALMDGPISEQLADGVRGLLIDTHYGDKLANGRVRTDFSSRADLRAAVHQDGLSDESVDAALRLRDRLGFRGSGERGMYLCHTFCELGATPLADVLEDLREFLATHPSDVVVVINQDYVTPEDFVGAIGDAGLTPYVFRGLDDSSWPTLGEMVESGQRLVLLAENRAGAAPWYQLAYDRLTMETPFSFSSASQLIGAAHLDASCRPNRGPAGAPLFLLNHWVTTDPVPLRSDASKVNAYAPLLARAKDCQRIRSHIPNLIAVNFERHGDVFRVVDTLNGVGGT
jgi:hypothetical protein